MAVESIRAERVDLFGGVHLHLVANYGAALGLPLPRMAFVLAVGLLAIAAIASSLRTHVSTVRALGAGLTLGGGIGNLVDRFVDRDGFPAQAVVDWIDVGDFPTFNLADAAILVGLWLWLRPTSHSHFAGDDAEDRRPARLMDVSR